MSLVKQTHELPCTDEALSHSQQARLPTTNISNISTINVPWKIETKWIIWSKPYRNDVAQAKAKTDLLKASVIQRAYLPSTIR